MKFVNLNSDWPATVDEVIVAFVLHADESRGNQARPDAGRAIKADNRENAL